MQLVRELLPGCFLLQSPLFMDERGSFVKSYHEEVYRQLGLNLEVRETFYSCSRRRVLRGMHFQLPPHAHDKLVHCIRGTVLDVLLDLRRGPDYGRFAAVELSGDNGYGVFVPKGVAHGFLAQDEEAIMLYQTSTVHVPSADCGIRWDSFGFDWGGAQPILSMRDQAHAPLADFDSPF